MMRKVNFKFWLIQTIIYSVIAIFLFLTVLGSISAFTVFFIIIVVAILSGFIALEN